LKKLERRGGGDGLGLLLNAISMVGTRIGYCWRTEAAAALGINVEEFHQRVDAANFTDEEVERLPAGVATRIRYLMGLTPEDRHRIRDQAASLIPAIRRHNAARSTGVVE
jgi:hypothetical protein